jgi:SanA protein
MKKTKKYFKKLVYLTLFGLIVILILNFYVKSKTKPLIAISSSELQQTDVAIIFGAGINGNVPSKYLKDRLDAGIMLFKANKINKILLSGDNGSDEHDELTVMKNYCFEHGVDTSKIYLDYAGFDTYSTMYRAKQIFKVEKAVLISQQYHLNRAIYIGNKLGVASVGFSANVGVYNGYTYVRMREYLSTFKSVLDILRNRKPRFLRESVSIDGPSNYTKTVY